MFTKAKQTFHPLPHFYVPPGFCFLARGLKTTPLPPLVRTLARDIQRCSSCSPPQGAGNSFYSPHFLALWLNLQPSDYTGLEHQAETFMEYCSSCTLLIVLPHFYSQRRNRSYACCGAFYVYRVAGFWKLWPPAKQELNEQLLACLIGYCIGKALPHFMLFYAYTLVNGMCPLGCVLTMMY